jgi:hypothetical protein
METVEGVDDVRYDRRLGSAAKAGGRGRKHEEQEELIMAQDKTLRCIGCGEDFVHDVKAQAFFAKMSFTEPKRCQPCRAARKRERQKTDDKRPAGNVAEPGGDQGLE